jgi:hypothetical protein
MKFKYLLVDKTTRRVSGTNSRERARDSLPASLVINTKLLLVYETLHTEAKPVQDPEAEREAEEDKKRREEEVEREKTFLQKLFELEEEYGIYIDGCGCCNSPHYFHGFCGDGGQGFLGDARRDFREQKKETTP